jgi:hypothetical protein
MKKIYTKRKFKKFNIKHAQESLKKNLISKEKKKIKRRGKNGISITEQRKEREISQLVNLKAPVNFSFIENTSEILTYLEVIQKNLERKKPILINLKDITSLTNDAIVLLLAVVKNPIITKGVTIKGNYPKNIVLKKIFQESGIFGSNNNSSNSNNYILTRRNKKAEGGIANELIRRATKSILGHEARCHGVYMALMECMANTCYHAKPQQIGQETWWLTVYHDKDLNIASFAFIDLGVGIFKSSKVVNLRKMLTDFFGFSDNRDVLKEIINGQQISRTQIPYRGKGLPNIFKGLERNYYSNLKIISNDVKADLSDNKYEILTREFNGTFLYWELNNKNRWIK